MKRDACCVKDAGEEFTYRRISEALEDKYYLNDFVSEYWNKQKELLSRENIEVKLDLSPEVSRKSKLEIQTHIL